MGRCALDRERPLDGETLRRLEPAAEEQPAPLAAERHGALDRVSRMDHRDAARYRLEHARRVLGELRRPAEVEWLHAEAAHIVRVAEVAEQVARAPVEQHAARRACARAVLNHEQHRQQVGATVGVNRGELLGVDLAHANAREQLGRRRRPRLAAVAACARQEEIGRAEQHGAAERGSLGCVNHACALLRVDGARAGRRAEPEARAAHFASHERGAEGRDLFARDLSALVIVVGVVVIGLRLRLGSRLPARFCWLARARWPPKGRFPRVSPSPLIILVLFVIVVVSRAHDGTSLLRRERLAKVDSSQTHERQARKSSRDGEHGENDEGLHRA